MGTALARAAHARIRHKHETSPSAFGRNFPPQAPVLSDNAGMGANYGSLGGLVGASIAAAFDSFGAARALLPPARPPGHAPL